MQHPITQQLFAYWNEVRASRAAPRRFDIEPAKIGTLLPHTFILERVDAQTYRYRLAGTAISEAYGRDFRNVNYLDGWTLGERVTMKRTLGSITFDAAVAVFHVRAASVSGVIDYEVMLLPLIHTGDTVDRYLGSMAPLDQPEWLGHDKIIASMLLESRLIHPSGPPSCVPDQRKVPDRQAPFSPHIRTARIVRVERRQFRVYEGGLASADD